jgi:ArsR family transcriptional regulator
MEYDAAKIFKALSNPSRLEIFRVIYKKGICGTFNGEAPTVDKCSCVGDIVEEFQLAPSTISHHIKELAQAGLVNMKRDGQFVCVYPNLEALETIKKFSESLERES